MTSADSSKISLYLDSSEGLTYGLLDSSLNWIEFRQENGAQKNSQVLHSNLYDLTKKHGLELKDIQQVFATVGPGSYTGIRLTYGLAKILEWNGSSLYTFYHHETPLFAGLRDYQFVCQAFKGEAFDYRYQDGKIESTLVTEADLKIEIEEIFSHQQIYKDKTKSTFDLLKNQSSDIFSSVIKENKQNEPYYFRPLDVEFKVAKER